MTALHASVATPPYKGIPVGKKYGFFVSVFGRAAGQRQSQGVGGRYERRAQRV
jgi:hypothetical protein